MTASPPAPTSSPTRCPSSLLVLSYLHPFPHPSSYYPLHPHNNHTNQNDTNKDTVTNLVVSYKSTVKWYQEEVDNMMRMYDMALLGRCVIMLIVSTMAI